MSFGSESSEGTEATNAYSVQPGRTEIITVHEILACRAFGWSLTLTISGRAGRTRTRYEYSLSTAYPVSGVVYARVWVVVVACLLAGWM